MKLAVLSDIWGIDHTLTSWVDEIKRSSGDMQYELLSPYQTKSLPHFRNDKDAYEFFSDNGGLQQYVETVRQWLAHQSEPVALVGFSAGAAVAFQLASEPCHPAVIFAVYGGQIHRMTHLELRCAAHLVFSNEPHFDVPSVVDTLNQQPLLNAVHWPYEHGFANPRSDGFNEKARQLLTIELHHWLDQLQRSMARR